MLWFHLYNKKKNEFETKIQEEIRNTIIHILEDDPDIKKSIEGNFKSYVKYGKHRTPDYIPNSNLFMI